MNYSLFDDLHLEELPIEEGTAGGMNEFELFDQMLKHIDLLVKEILWLRYLSKRDLKRWDGRDMRKESVSYLLGGFRNDSQFKAMLGKYYDGTDPADVEDFVKQLVYAHNQMKLLEEIEQFNTADYDD